MKRASILGVLLIAMAGCAEGTGAGPTTPAPTLTDVSMISAGAGTDHFVMRLQGGRGVDALVTPRGVTAPGISLSRYPDPSDHAIRGDAFNRVANIDITATGAKGLYGGGPMNVEAALEGQDLHVTGTVAGKITDFKISPTGINGSVGSCMFQMTRRGAIYDGTRGCGKSSEPANLSFPAAFEKWSLPELSVALVILLSSGA